MVCARCESGARTRRRWARREHSFHQQVELLGLLPDDVERDVQGGQARGADTLGVLRQEGVYDKPLLSSCDM